MYTNNCDPGGLMVLYFIIFGVAKKKTSGTLSLFFPFNIYLLNTVITLSYIYGDITLSTRIEKLVSMQNYSSIGSLEQLTLHLGDIKLQLRL